MRCRLVRTTVMLGLAASVLNVVPTPGAAEPVNQQEGAMAIQEKDKEAVKGLVLAYADAWNARAPEQLTRLFAPEGEFINIFGGWGRSRDEVVANHRQVLTTAMRASRLEVVSTEVRFLAPDVAVHHADWRLSGAIGPAGAPLPEILGRQTGVAQRHDGRWVFQAVQNTTVVGPQPAAR